MNAKLPGGGEYGRGARRDVRNPVLALQAISRLDHVSPDARHLLGSILRDLSVEARIKAVAAWDRRKGPTAAYWQAVSVYAKHIARAIDPR